MKDIAIYLNEHFDIILQGGQSNAQGCGYGPVVDTDEYMPDGDILYMVNACPDDPNVPAEPLDGFSIEVAGERMLDSMERSDLTERKVNDFSLSFAKLYRQRCLRAGRKVLILRTAVGGTGWIDKRWGMTDDLYLNMMRMAGAALGLNKENRLAAFIWHQGETDAGTPRGDHYDNLSRLVNSVRDTFGCPDLPFIAGDFVSEWKNKNLGACEPLVEAIRGVCTGPRGAFVETYDLKSNNLEHGDGDDIHFSRNALNKLGSRYFEAYMKITGL